MDPLHKLFSEAVLRDIAADLGIAGDAPEMQGAALSLIGEAVIAGVLAGALQRVPTTERPRFNAFVEEGNFENLASLLSEHIPDLDAFIRGEAEKELTAIKARAGELSGA